MAACAASRYHSSMKTAVQNQLAERQLALLYSAIPNSLFASIFGSVVAELIFRDVINPFRLWSWIGLMVFVSAYRIWDYRQYRHSDHGTHNNDQWLFRFRIGALLQAFAVGSGGLLLFAFDDSSYQMLLALMMVCIGSFATTTLAPHRPIVVMFMMTAFLPLALLMYMQGTEVSIYISWFVILLIIMLVISALRINKTITDSMTLSIEAMHREERLRDYEQRVSMFIENTSIGVVEWSQDRRIVRWNEAAERMFGYPESQALDLEPAALMFSSHDEAIQKMWDKLLTSSTAVVSIMENRRRDGSLILCEWITTPLINPHNEFIGAISLVQDVTEKIANEKLKSEFISIVGHELRTPVTSIKGGLSLLASGVLDDDPAQSREMLAVALDNTNRLQMLINDILDVEKLESGRMEYQFGVHDLADLINRVVVANAAYAEQYSAKVVTDMEPGACLVKMDPDRMFQVLTNLLSNAIKFSEPGNDVSIRLEKDDGGFRVSVTNRGEVIPEEDRANMFTKFFQRDSSTTRKKGGTGLGLYICQKILSEHGGDIDFTSSAQTGTSFFFSLPKVDSGKS
jgi:PAS domain S-box-containing protein